MTPLPTWIPIACALGFGLAIFLLVWQLMRSAEAVPAEDRSYRDAPPSMFRMMWWPVRWISYYLGPHLRPVQRQRILTRLRLAGLDYALLPEQFIAGQILLGFSRPDVAQVEVDRARAIAGTITEAAGADVILLAGKGHEAYQEIAGQRHPFSDVQQARDALAARSDA